MSVLNIRSALTCLSALLFPGYCPSCLRAWQDDGGFICADCWRNVKPPVGGIWHRNRELRRKVTAAFAYEPALRLLVHYMKFYGRRDLAARLGRETARRCAGFIRSAAPAAVVPVPLHPVRLRERGYDQSLVLARAVAAESGLELRTDLIRRIRHTRPQSHLPDRTRLVNVAGVFAPADSVQPPPQTALVVDDVIHTGATVTGCMEALAGMGVERVFALTACG